MHSYITTFPDLEVKIYTKEIRFVFLLVNTQKFEVQNFRLRIYCSLIQISYNHRVGQYRNEMFPNCNIHPSCNGRASQDIARRARNSRYNCITNYRWTGTIYIMLCRCYFSTYSLHVVSLSILKYPVFFKFVQ